MVGAFTGFEEAFLNRVEVAAFALPALRPHTRTLSLSHTSLFTVFLTKLQACSCFLWEAGGCLEPGVFFLATTRTKKKGPGESVSNYGQTLLIQFFHLNFALGEI